MMVVFEIRSTHACFGGMQGFYQHQSTVIGLPMRFAVYQPPQAQQVIFVEHLYLYYQLYKDHYRQCHH